MFAQIKSTNLVRCFTKRLSAVEINLNRRKLSMEHHIQMNSSTRPYSIPFSTDLKTELKNEHDQLMRIFPGFVKDLTECVKSTYEKDIAKHYEAALEYNVPTGLNNRALTTILTYKSIVDKEYQTEDELYLVRLLGWCTELIHGSFIITDDIVDGSHVRRNNPCWYKLIKVGSEAVNDAIMIENGVYIILKKYFEHFPNYVDLIELFHETTMITAIGQSIDCDSARKGIQYFKKRAHQYASYYKNSHLGFYAPIVSPMILKGKTDSKVLHQIKAICFEIGHFYQSQNDYFDFFNESHVLRKPGTDIEDGRCTWLSIAAMERATSEQRKVLIECYGKKDTECIQRVRKIYEEMDFPKLFKQYKNDTYNLIYEKIQRTSGPRNVMKHTLDLTFNQS